MAPIRRANQFALDARYPTHAKQVARWIRSVAESYDTRTKRGFGERQREGAVEAFLSTAAEYRTFVSASVAKTASNTYTRTEYAMFASWLRSRGTQALIGEMAHLAQATRDKFKPSSLGSDRSSSSRGSDRPSSGGSHRGKPGDTVD